MLKTTNDITGQIQKTILSALADCPLFLMSANVAKRQIKLSPSKIRGIIKTVKAFQLKPFAYPLESQ